MPSTTVVPSGIGTASTGPIDSILPSLTSTVCCAITVSDDIGTTLTLTNAVGAAHATEVSSNATGSAPGIRLRRMTEAPMTEDKDRLQRTEFPPAERSGNTLIGLPHRRRYRRR